MTSRSALLARVTATLRRFPAATPAARASAAAGESRTDARADDRALMRPERLVSPPRPAARTAPPAPGSPNRSR